MNRKSAKDIGNKYINLPEPIAEILRNYCNPKALELSGRIGEDILSGSIPKETAKLFREQLREATNGKLLTPEQYKLITGDNEYNTPEKLQLWMHELWQITFPNDSL